MNRKFYALQALLGEEILLMLHLRRNVVNTLNCTDRKQVKYGKRRSDYHDVFTDHKLTIGRKRCPDCNYEPGSTIKGSVAKTFKI